MTAPAPVRNAVTVMLVRPDPLRVLMVHRGEVGAFAGALAFPGGVVDPEDTGAEWDDVLVGTEGLDADERARRAAVVRELFEETGLVLGADPSPVAPRDANVPDLLRAAGVRVDVSAVRPVGRWITPEGPPKRFDTWFYVAEAAGSAESAADGVEITEVEWLEPGEVARLASAGERRLLLPTLANLDRLDRSAGDYAAWADAFAAAPEPVRPTVRTRPDGSRVAVLPETGGYRAVEFPLP